MTLTRRIAITLGFTALVGVAAIQAENLRTAQVPFAFEVSGHKLDAGTYSVAHENGGSVTLHNIDSGQTAFVMSGSPDTNYSDQSSMTFTCYNSHCFLSKVKFSSSQKEYQVPRSKHEKEIAQTATSEQRMIAMR